MTFIQFVYDMEGIHMTSSAVNTCWWSKGLSAHSLIDQTGSTGPGMQPKFS